MKNAFRAIGAIVLVGLSTAALAAPPVLTDLTAAVDTSTIATAMLSVGAIAVGIRLVWVAVKYVKGMAKGV